MDFFSAQHRSRRNSAWLVLVFLLSAAGVVLVMYMALSAGWILYSLVKAGGIRALIYIPDSHPPFWDGGRFVWVAAVTGGCIAAGALCRTVQISRHGGSLIAMKMGGKWVRRETMNPAEKRLLNVTDEMAVAAGIPAPVVYVLADESGLNAFAAGFSTRNSVVCVTRGLLDALDRDELQGVVGHEISHIVNGDSRLNLRLIGVLYGFQFFSIIGRSALGINFYLSFFGCILYGVGSVGLFFGKVIQAVISREREYLADASSAQFTRNPLSLADALNKLRSGGSRVTHPEAMAVSHLFFGSTVLSGALSGLLATHPPITERIRRLGGTPRFASARSLWKRAGRAERSRAPEPAAPLDDSAGDAVPVDVPADGVAQARQLLDSLPETLRRHSRTVAGAAGIVCGLFFQQESDARLSQEAALPPGAQSAALELHQWLAAQEDGGARYRLVWLDLALPTLHEASASLLRQLFDAVKTLIAADGRTGPGEFALYSLLRGALRSPEELRRQARSAELRPERLDSDICLLLALIAHAGGADASAAENAYRAAMAVSPARSPLPFPAAAGLSLTAVSGALAHLAAAAPRYREKVLQACAAAVRHDGNVTAVENELLRAFAQSLDCPAPL